MPNSKSSKKNSEFSSHLQDVREQISLEISKLSYEKSIKGLDEILNKLKSENLLVEELQINHLKANLYIEHCESLLDHIEQEIIEINTKDLY